MATATFATVLKPDGSLFVPREAVEDLGLHPGDEVQVRLETFPSRNQADFDGILAELFAEAENLEPKPGLTAPLDGKATVSEMVAEKFRLTKADRARMQVLMEQYRDTPMDFADASLVAAAESLGEEQIFTLDSDFYVYQRYGSQPFEVVA